MQAYRLPAGEPPALPAHLFYLSQFFTRILQDFQQTAADKAGVVDVVHQRGNLPAGEQALAQLGEGGFAQSFDFVDALLHQLDLFALLAPLVFVGGLRQGVVIEAEYFHQLLAQGHVVLINR